MIGYTSIIQALEIPSIHVQKICLVELQTNKIGIQASSDGLEADV